MNNLRVRNASRSRSSPSWMSWWKSHINIHKDRWIIAVSVIPVIIFLLAVFLSISYLHSEDVKRDQQSLERDSDYAQRHLRLRLLEKQDQLEKIAQALPNNQKRQPYFNDAISQLLDHYPWLSQIAWIDSQKGLLNVREGGMIWLSAVDLQEILTHHQFDGHWNYALQTQRPVIAFLEFPSPLAPINPPQILCALIVPPNKIKNLQHGLVATVTLEALLQYDLPSNLLPQYSVAILSKEHEVLAGILPDHLAPSHSFFDIPVQEKMIALSPEENVFLLMRAFQTNKGILRDSMLWIIMLLSLFTVIMLFLASHLMRKRLIAQRALHAETNFRRAMENAMVIGTCALDIHGRITYVNTAFCKMTGFRSDELIGQAAPFPYWPPTDIAYLTKVLDDEMTGKIGEQGIEVKFQNAKGQLFDVRIHVAPLLAANGKQAGWMRSITDISESQRIKDELIAAHERFKTVLQSLDAAVSVAGLGGKDLLFANRQYLEWFDPNTAGHHEMLMQAQMELLSAIEESDHPEIYERHLLSSGDTLMDPPDSAEVYIDRLDLWLEVRSRYLTWVDGRVVQMVIANDITSKRQAELQALEQAERAQNAHRLMMMGEMASTVAHELNQPLTAINNYAQGLISRIKEKTVDSPQVLEALEKVSKQAERAGQIIARIRSFIKRSSPSNVFTEVQLIVNEALELIELDLRKHQVHLTYHIEPELPPIYGDPILIAQVLINLIKNAIESINSSEHNLREITLNVSSLIMGPQQMVQFELEDSGPGIAPDALERIYDAFFTTKKNGMGIGLKLCRSIIEAHQGKISVHNIEKGNQIVGCRFTFCLPTRPPLLDSSPPPTQIGHSS